MRNSFTSSNNKRDIAFAFIYAAGFVGLSFVAINIDNPFSQIRDHVKELSSTYALDNTLGSDVNSFTRGYHFSKKYPDIRNPYIVRAILDGIERVEREPSSYKDFPKTEIHHTL